MRINLDLAGLDTVNLPRDNLLVNKINSPKGMYISNN